MKKEDLLGSLRAIELRLSTSEVNAYIRTQPDDVRNDFVKWSIELSVVVSHLETAEFSRIAAELQENEQALKESTQRIQNEIISLSNARKLIDTLSSMLTLLGSILVML